MSTFSLPTSYSRATIPVVRLGGSVMLALSITVFLFFLMQQLITPAHKQNSVILDDFPIVQLYEKPDESAVVIKKTLPEKPDLTPPELPRTTVDSVDTRSKVTLQSFTPNVDIGRAEQAPFSSGLGNKQATPLVRVEPRFPTDAARQGISGWVVLSFSIDETGAVTDITVLNAEPRNMFDREAIRALRRWKYQPQIVDGKAIKQQNLQVQLDFQLAQEP